ncbi:MAG: S8 family serine peptidase [Marinicellaceae bacterium]
MKKLDTGAFAPQNHRFKPLKKAIATLVLATLSQVSIAQDIHPIKAESPQVEDKIITYAPSTIIPNQYIVVFKEELVSEKAEQLTQRSHYTIKEAKTKVITDLSIDLATKASGSLERTYTSAINGFVLKSASKKAVEIMSKDDRVAFIEQDQRVSIEATQNNATWGLDRIDQANLPLNNTYIYDQNGSGVNAYVVDTGVRTSHSQFGGRASSGFTAINDGNGSNDCNGHGTHVAGTVGSSTYGVAKNVNIVAVRVLDCAGSGSNSGVLAGIDWVKDNHVKPAVANMSLGGGSSTALDNAVNAAVAAGVTMVVAAGNENQNACNVSPARAANAITVGSTTSSDRRSSFSNYGSCLDIYAPGSSITSTWYTGNSSTNTISGTSMAAPHVAGVAALYLDDNPNASPAQVQAAIENASIANKVSDARTGSPNLLLNNDFGGGTPPPPPPPTGGTLSNGVAKTGLSGATGSQANFTLSVPAGATNLTFNMSGGSGDADLYVKFGSAPTTSSYDCRPYIGGNNESCPISNAQSGTYYVMVVAYSTYSNVSLVGSYTASSGGGQSLFTNNSNVNIPDNNPTGATSNINVTRNGNSNTIKISYNIVHTYRGDLKVEIFAPNGASAVLREPSGGGTDNIVDSNTLNAGSTPANGVWRLKVIDNAGADVGYINSWSIEFL